MCVQGSDGRGYVLLIQELMRLEAAGWMAVPCDDGLRHLQAGGCRLGPNLRHLPDVRFTLPLSHRWSPARDNMQ